MTPHAERVLRYYVALDKLLVAKGWPPTSPWWLETIRRWYEAGTPELVDRVGRRGGKSSTLCRLAVVEALYGLHVIPPGDTGMVAIISTDRPEASSRLRTIRAILDALGVSYRWNASEKRLEIVGRPIAFRVFTATVAGVSGFTAIFVFCDEVAKWKDADTGQNPATIVLGSVRPTMMTMPNARMVLSSSAMGQADAHYDAFEQGDSDKQTTAYAPTWVANPTLTEGDCQKRAKDMDEFLREYKSIPANDYAEGMLNGEDIERSRRRPPGFWDVTACPLHDYVATIDPATRGNAWTLIVATLDEHNRRKVVLAREWRGTKVQPLGVKATLTEIASLIAPYRLTTVWSDQRGGDELRELADQVGITLIQETSTQASNLERYRDLNVLLREDRIELHPDPMIVRDLKGVLRRYTRAGVTVELVKTPDGRHSDYAPSVALAMKVHLNKPKTAAPTLGTTQWEEAAAAERLRQYEAGRERPRWAPAGHGQPDLGAAWRRRTG